MINPSPIFLNRLDLCAFRNHAEARIIVPNASVVITGDNGSGKTNILEAISLLSPGRGLRSAQSNAWQNDKVKTPWAVAGRLQSGNGEVRISTGCNIDANASERRVMLLDGKPLRNRTALAEQISIIWLIPEMDGVLGDGTSARRALLDRLTISIFPQCADALRQHEKAMRERARLLRDGCFDASWLNALEDTLARAAVIIATSRCEWAERINAAMTESLGDSGFPAAYVTIAGRAETLVQQNQPALLIEDALRAELAESRLDDARTGITSIGAHRSVLQVSHAATNRVAEIGSTGEKKALLLAIIIAHARALGELRGQLAIMLLDDVLDHLDKARRRALFSALALSKAQAWLSGTDEADFASFRDAYHVRVSDNIRV